MKLSLYFSCTIKYYIVTVIKDCDYEQMFQAMSCLYHKKEGVVKNVSKTFN